MNTNIVLPIEGNPVNVETSLQEGIYAGDISSNLNFRKSLFNLLNDVSSKKYSLLTADFIKPTRAPDNSKRNTNVLLIELPDLGLFNPKNVWYNRIHTSILGTIMLPKGTAIKVSDLIVEINGYLNTSILASELDDFVLPTADAIGRASFTLLFNDTSFRYYSGPEVVIFSDSSGASVTKETLGLDRVDNTRDIEKPVSIHQQAAIDTNATQLRQFVSDEINQAVFDSNGGASSVPLWTRVEW